MALTCAVRNCVEKDVTRRLWMDIEGAREGSASNLASLGSRLYSAVTRSSKCLLVQDMTPEGLQLEAGLLDGACGVPWTMPRETELVLSTRGACYVAQAGFSVCHCN